MIDVLQNELRQAYSGKRAFVTGHTGFKGCWLTHWLAELGAQVVGYSLAPPTSPSMFEATRAADVCESVDGDVRDADSLMRELARTRPDYIFHLAAQPLVRASYEAPLDTVHVNVLGTANLLDAIRRLRLRCTVVVVTSDKCYENREWVYGYREDDPMGGHDVYSMSKGAAELVVASYRRSFFNPADVADHGVALATARAGNVIGGGDWADDRIIPDVVRALATDQSVRIRRPRAVRPWQHVLEPLSGYLLLGARLAASCHSGSGRFCEAWNFGPAPHDARTVAEVVDAFLAAWGDGTRIDESQAAMPHEAGLLRLSIDKAIARLGWSPRWGFDTAVARTAEWYKAYYDLATPNELRSLCREQITTYIEGRTHTTPAVCLTQTVP